MVVELSWCSGEIKSRSGTWDTVHQKIHSNRLSQVLNTNIDYDIGSTSKLRLLWESDTRLPQTCSCLAWDHSSRLYAGCNDGSIQMWDGYEMRSVFTLLNAPVKTLCPLWCDEFVSVGDAVGGIHIYNRTGELKVSMKHVPGVRGRTARCSIKDIACSPPGTKLVSAAEDTVAVVWDVATGQQERSLEEHGWDVLTVHWHPTLALIVTGCKDSHLRIWDTRVHRPIHTAFAHKHAVTRARWSPDGSLLASGSRDQSLRLFSLARMEEFQVLQGNDREITSLEWDPSQSATLTSGNYLGALYLWNLPFNEPVGIKNRAHHGGLWALAYHPGGNMLSSSGNDKVVRIWSTSHNSKNFCNENITNLPVNTIKKLSEIINNRSIDQILNKDSLSVENISFDKESIVNENKSNTVVDNEYEKQINNEGENQVLEKPSTYTNKGMITSKTNFYTSELQIQESDSMCNNNSLSLEGRHHIDKDQMKHIKIIDKTNEDNAFNIGLDNEFNKKDLIENNIIEESTNSSSNILNEDISIIPFKRMSPVYSQELNKKSISMNKGQNYISDLDESLICSEKQNLKDIESKPESLQDNCYTNNSESNTTSLTMLNSLNQKVEVIEKTVPYNLKTSIPDINLDSNITSNESIDFSNNIDNMKSNINDSVKSETISCDYIEAEDINNVTYNENSNNISDQIQKQNASLNLINTINQLLAQNFLFSNGLTKQVNTKNITPYISIREPNYNILLLPSTGNIKVSVIGSKKNDQSKTIPDPEKMVSSVLSRKVTWTNLKLSSTKKVTFPGKNSDYITNKQNISNISELYTNKSLSNKIFSFIDCQLLKNNLINYATYLQDNDYLLQSVNALTFPLQFQLGLFSTGSEILSNCNYSSDTLIFNKLKSNLLGRFFYPTKSHPTKKLYRKYLDIKLNENNQFINEKEYSILVDYKINSHDENIGQSWVVPPESIIIKKNFANQYNRKLFTSTNNITNDIRVPTMEEMFIDGNNYGNTRKKYSTRNNYEDDQRYNQVSDINNDHENNYRKISSNISGRRYRPRNDGINRSSDNHYIDFPVQDTSLYINPHFFPRHNDIQLTNLRDRSLLRDSMYNSGIETAHNENIYIDNNTHNWDTRRNYPVRGDDRSFHNRNTFPNENRIQGILPTTMINNYDSTTYDENYNNTINDISDDWSNYPQDWTWDHQLSPVEYWQNDHWQCGFPTSNPNYHNSNMFLEPWEDDDHLLTPICNMRNSRDTEKIDYIAQRRAYRNKKVSKERHSRNSRNTTIDIKSYNSIDDNLDYRSPSKSQNRTSIPKSNKNIITTERNDQSWSIVNTPLTYNTNSDIDEKKTGKQHRWTNENDRKSFDTKSYKSSNKGNSETLDSRYIEDTKWKNTRINSRTTTRYNSKKNKKSDLPQVRGSHSKRIDHESNRYLKYNRKNNSRNSKTNYSKNSYYIPTPDMISKHDVQNEINNSTTLDRKYTHYVHSHSPKNEKSLKHKKSTKYSDDTRSHLNDNPISNIKNQKDTSRIKSQKIVLDVKDKASLDSETKSKKKLNNSRKNYVTRPSRINTSRKNSRRKVNKDPKINTNSKNNRQNYKINSLLTTYSNTSRGRKNSRTPRIYQNKSNKVDESNNFSNVLENKKKNLMNQKSDNYSTTNNYSKERFHKDCKDYQTTSKDTTSKLTRTYSEKESNQLNNYPVETVVQHRNNNSRDRTFIDIQRHVKDTYKSNKNSFISSSSYEKDQNTSIANITNVSREISEYNKSEKNNDIVYNISHQSLPLIQNQNLQEDSISDKKSIIYKQRNRYNSRQMTSSRTDRSLKNKSPRQRNRDNLSMTKNKNKTDRSNNRYSESRIKHNSSKNKSSFHDLKENQKMNQKEDLKKDRLFHSREKTNIHKRQMKKSKISNKQKSRANSANFFSDNDSRRRISGTNKGQLNKQTSRTKRVKSRETAELISDTETNRIGYSKKEHSQIKKRKKNMSHSRSKFSTISSKLDSVIKNKKDILDSKHTDKANCDWTNGVHDKKELSNKDQLESVKRYKNVNRTCSYASKSSQRKCNIDDHSNEDRSIQDRHITKMRKNSRNLSYSVDHKLNNTNQQERNHRDMKNIDNTRYTQQSIITRSRYQSRDNENTSNKKTDIENSNKLLKKVPFLQNDEKYKTNLGTDNKIDSSFCKPIKRQAQDYSGKRLTTHLTETNTKSEYNDDRKLANNDQFCEKNSLLSQEYHNKSNHQLDKTAIDIKSDSKLKPKAPEGLYRKKSPRINEKNNIIKHKPTNAIAVLGEKIRSSTGITSSDKSLGKNSDLRSDYITTKRSSSIQSTPVKPSAEVMRTLLRMNKRSGRANMDKYN